VCCWLMSDDDTIHVLQLSALPFPLKSMAVRSARRMSISSPTGTCTTYLDASHCVTIGLWCDACHDSINDSAHYVAVPQPQHGLCFLQDALQVCCPAGDDLYCHLSTLPACSIHSTKAAAAQQGACKDVVSTI
jgi:hypothetical protein